MPYLQIHTGTKMCRSYDVRFVDLNLFYFFLWMEISSMNDFGGYIYHLLKFTPCFSECDTCKSDVDVQLKQSHVLFKISCDIISFLQFCCHT